MMDFSLLLLLLLSSAADVFVAITVIMTEMCVGLNLAFTIHAL